jgi:hypothetical protein
METKILFALIFYRAKRLGVNSLTSGKAEGTP